MPKVAFIIVTFNGEKWIEKCLKSILSSTVAAEIFVIDNGSEDGTVKILENYPTIRLVRNDENKGFGKANNQGLELAYLGGYEYFFLLNQDASVEPDTIQKLTQCFSESETLGIVSPIHMNGTGTDLDEGFGRFMRMRRSSGFYRDYRNDRLKEHSYLVSFVNAAAWLISRKCLEKVGLFHPAFSHYGEDDNYIHRAKYHGFEVGVCANTRIYHDRDGTLKNRKRADPRLKFSRIALQHLLNPNIRFGHFLRVFFILLISKGRWSYFPDFAFYIWGVREYFVQKRRAVSFGGFNYNPLPNPQ